MIGQRRRTRLSMMRVIETKKGFLHRHVSKTPTLWRSMSGARCFRTTALTKGRSRATLRLPRSTGCYDSGDVHQNPYQPREACAGAPEYAADESEGDGAGPGRHEGRR